MELKNRPFRVSLALLAVVVLSAFSAAEATLASVLPFERLTSESWPAQLSPLRDRDAGQQRVIRPDERKMEDRAAGEHFSSAGPAAIFEGSPATVPSAVVDRLCGSIHHITAADRLGPHRLNLPPPMV